ncbi:MAG: hypothetical protein ACXVID_09675, partial [Thermoanaerobaculia bacterium]
MRRIALALAVLLAGLVSREAVGTSIVTAEAWKPVAAAGVDVSLSPLGRPGVRMTYDFHGGSGWAGVRRGWAVVFPDDWTLSFRVRGAGTANTLEIKFLDSSGENVWWARRESFSASDEWRTIAVKKRQVSFAWGPAGGGAFPREATLEIVLSAGTGGRGILEVEEPVLAAREKLSVLPEPSVARTSEGILVDFGGVREFSGVVVDWTAPTVPTRFTVEISSDESHFTTVRRVDRGGARRAWLHLPETEARLVR